MQEAADVWHALRLHLFIGLDTTDEHFTVRCAHHTTDITLQRILALFAWSPRRQTLPASMQSEFFIDNLLV